MGKRIADVDILMVPGWTKPGPEHWQSRWQERLSTARRVEQPNWNKPNKDEWVANIIKAVDACRQPVVLIGHSLGVVAIAHAAPHIPKGDVIGAFLVAPASETTIELEDAIDNRFAPVPRQKLPFTSVLIASRNDPCCPFLTAEEYATGWGADFVDAGNAGHLNTDSGHGPWPEGLMRFAGFMAKM